MEMKGPVLYSLANEGRNYYYFNNYFPRFARLPLYDPFVPQLFLFVSKISETVEKFPSVRFYLPDGKALVSVSGFKAT